MCWRRQRRQHLALPHMRKNADPNERSVLPLLQRLRLFDERRAERDDLVFDEFVVLGHRAGIDERPHDLPNGFPVGIGFRLCRIRSNALHDDRANVTLSVSRSGRSRSWGIAPLAGRSGPGRVRFEWISRRAARRLDEFPVLLREFLERNPQRLALARFQDDGVAIQFQKPPLSLELAGRVGPRARGRRCVDGHEREKGHDRQRNTDGDAKWRREYD